MNFWCTMPPSQSPPVSITLSAMKPIESFISTYGHNVIRKNSTTKMKSSKSVNVDHTVGQLQIKIVSKFNATEKINKCTHLQTSTQENSVLHAR
jgi:hypothetical protein